MANNGRAVDQQGFTLIEGLVSILIFSVGILGLVAMQANAINLSTDAKHRADAAFLANQLLGQLTVANPAQIEQFAHRPSGTTTCSPTGTESSHATVTAWLAQVSLILPNASASKQQIKVDSSDNSISITICWQAPQGALHHYSLVSQFQWQ